MRVLAYIKMSFEHERKILYILTEEGLHVLALLEVPLDLEDLPDLLRPLSLLLLLLQLLWRLYMQYGYQH
jgi:glycerol-3-phosphate O-acyltransferase